MSDISDEPASRGAPHPTLADALVTWLKIGVVSFGGPAGQIALMHRIVVEEKRWIDEARFLHALNYCMLLPGPEAQQLAVYLGWLLHRTIGGLVAGILFVLPGVIVMIALSISMCATTRSRSSRGFSGAYVPPFWPSWSMRLCASAAARCATD